MARDFENWKAVDPVVLDVRGMVSYTDFFVIISGSSKTQVRALCEKTVEKYGSPAHQEFSSDDSWVVLDYLDVVVHIFHPETREYYGLERLWGDAPLVSF